MKSVFKIGCYYTMHPAPLSSLHPAHFNLHSDHLNLHPVLCNTLNIIRISLLYVLGNFPKFRPKNSKLSILTQNWPSNEFGGADSKFGLIFFEIRNPKSIFGQIWAEKPKLSVLPENWYTWYLENVDSYSNISFLNLQP